jgi:hypothetical protein
MKKLPRFTRLAALVPALLAALIPWANAQQEIGFIEDFALAEDREIALKKLIPGTEDYYYFHALHYQNTRETRRLADILTQWVKRSPNSNLRNLILNREALLNYSRDPKQSLEHIRSELNLQFNHQQEGKARAREFSSFLKQEETSWDKFLADALRGTRTLQNINPDEFFDLLASEHALTGTQKRDLLSRANNPDLPDLVTLILEDLKSPESRGFGEFNIHRALTIAQLDQLRDERKSLLLDVNYVHTYLAKLRPGSDVNPATEPESRRSYLERVWKFASQLGPSFNSLRAHLLYQRLVFDYSQGVHDAKRFMTYVKLPRRAAYIHPDWARKESTLWRHPANLGQDFRKITGLAPIGTDEPVVRSYLLHFLRESVDYRDYAPYFREKWLKSVFAEAKIVNGVGDPERWTSLLSPNEFQSLKDRVDIEFAPSSPEHFGISDNVRLRVHLKNVETLIVKVFEVNTLNYYLKHGAEISTDLALDGLVTNHERTFEYQDAPQRRVARDFEFPEIENRRGVWIVEFIGGSKSSRALIRKGQLQLLSSTTSGGEAITVLDEERKPTPGSAIWFGGRRYGCDEKGRTLIPFSNEPGKRTPVIETPGGFASLAHFQHSSESYNLHAGIRLEREALRPGAKATIMVRPTLTVAEQPISLTRLEKVRLVIVSTDLDGVSTTSTVNDFKIASDRESTHEIRVPDRLSSLNIRLVATTKMVSQGQKEIELSANQTFIINGQLRSDRIKDLFLSRVDGKYIVQLLGRSGEPVTGQHLNIKIQRPNFKNSRSFTLKTDQSGRVELGPLDGVMSITARTAENHQRVWQLSRARRTNPGVIHAADGETMRIPYTGGLTRRELALHAISTAGIISDAFKALTLEDGFLVTGNLEPGDYRLLLKKSNQAITLRVARGTVTNGHIFNSTRTLELIARNPSHLTSLSAQGQSLEVQVANSDKTTRVHIIATRFLPDFDLFDFLAHAPRGGLFSGTPGHLPNLYVSGRKIGDEFRYVLERRYARKLPGNMLERPEIILHPWAMRDTGTEGEILMEGENYDRALTGQAAKGERTAGPAPEEQSEENVPAGSTVDFLVNGPVSLTNLQPDEKGRLSIDLDAFGDRQHVHVLVLDHHGASYADISLPERATEIADLRLRRALDPDRHFTEQDSVTLLKKGERLEITDLSTAQLEVFENLSSAYSYLLAVREDATLRQFEFILNWPNLKEEEKRLKYSQFACHELNFFLWKKDPRFFREVIAPFLTNKRDQTFIDKFLLGAELRPYLEPFEYERLNSVERILLAHRAEDRLESTQWDFRDRLALRPPDLNRYSQLFDGALATGGLTFNTLNKAQDETKRRFQTNAEAASAPESFQSDFGDAWGAGDGAGDANAKQLGGRALRRSLDQNSLSQVVPSKGPTSVSETEFLGLAQDKIQASARQAQKLLTDRRKTNQSAKEGASDPYASDLAIANVDALYRPVETTKEWAETNYYHLPIVSQTHDLIAESRFWLDYVQHEKGKPFGSRHLGEASRSLHETLLALAVLDLPFASPESGMDINGPKLVFTAGDSAIAFHREIKEAQLAENRPPLLVSQSYFRHGDRHQIENGEKTDKFVTDEFVASVIYGAQVVVTNPTSSRQKLDVLLQIPEGAMPLLGHRATGTRNISLDPYTTKRLDYFFYFPAPGNYQCYPAHVSQDGSVIAHAEKFTFKVVSEPSRVDESSWAHVSQWGTEEQVLAYLSKRNLHNINLLQIAWRCRESRDFFGKALEILHRRGKYHRELYSYGLFHGHVPIARQFLLVDGRYLDSCGDYLSSEVVTIDPIARRAYEHLEYKPLVNNRAHTVGGTRKILNGHIRSHYQNFLRILSQKPSLNSSDQLSITYYLFLQDRAEDAMRRLETVDSESLSTRIQYDYFRAYSAFYQANPGEARNIAAKYTGHPVDRWRERFVNVIAQADEIEGKGPQITNEEDRDQQQARLAASEPSLKLRVDGSLVTIDYQQVTNIQVNYYEMDLEFLFSTNPFVSSGSDGFSVVQPNKSERLQLPDSKRSHNFELPREYQSKNVLIEVTGGGKKRSLAVYSNELNTVVSERYGILTVRHSGDNRPLPATYVKIYALTDAGPQFYKDGYTDLRGKFDYASVSTSDIGSALKFSILVMNETNGATVLEAPVPQQ